MAERIPFTGKGVGKTCGAREFCHVGAAEVEMEWFYDDLAVVLHQHVAQRFTHQRVFQGQQNTIGF